MEQVLYLPVLLGLLLTVSLLLINIWYKHRSQFSGDNRPPGNIGLPYVGENYQFFSTGWKGQPEKFFFDRISKFSSTVFKTSLLGEPVAVFCGAACNKFLFSNEDKLVQTWWPSSIHRIFPSSIHKEDAKKQRKMLPQFMKPEALQIYVGIMDTVAQTHFAGDWDGKDEVVVFPLAKRFTFLVACRLFVSVDDPSKVAKFVGPFSQITSGLVSVPIDLPGTPFGKAIKASKYIKKELLLKLIKERKIDLAEGKATPTQDILSRILLATDDEGKHMKELDIADRILGLLVGGYDTLSVACTFIVKFLADLPHIYDQVYKEQMEIAASKAAGELLNWKDLQKMKYSWNVACEVMRIAPPSAGGFKEVITDFVFNGFTIPKGWKIHWSINATHKNADYFPKPEKFDPTRFDGSGPAPYTFLPFGGGPRMCPGQEYSRLVMLVFMHNLVKRFKWEKVILDEKIVVDPMPRPAKGLPVRLRHHKP